MKNLCIYNMIHFFDSFLLIAILAAKSNKSPTPSLAIADVSKYFRAPILLAVLKPSSNIIGLSFIFPNSLIISSFVLKSFFVPTNKIGACGQ